MQIIILLATIMKKMNNNVDTLQNDVNVKNDNNTTPYEDLDFDLDLSAAELRPSMFANFIETQRKNLKTSNKYVNILLLALVLFFMGLFISREIALHKDRDKIVDLTKHVGKLGLDMNEKNYETIKQTLELRREIDADNDSNGKSLAKIKTLEAELNEKQIMIDSFRKQINIHLEDIDKLSESQKKDLEAQKIKMEQNIQQEMRKKDEDIAELKQKLNKIKSDNNTSGDLNKNENLQQQNEKSIQELREKEALILNLKQWINISNAEMKKMKNDIEHSMLNLNKKDNEISDLSGILKEYSRNISIYEDMEEKMEEQFNATNNLGVELQEKEKLIRMKDYKINELSDQINNFTIVMTNLSAALNEAKHNVSVSTYETNLMLNESMKNISALSQDIDMLKEEFPQVKIKLYLPHLNPHNDSKTYTCAILNCKQEFLRDDLIHHLMDNHSQEVFVGSEMSRKTAMLRTWDRSYMLSHGELFRIGSQVFVDGQIWFYVMLFGPDHLAKNFGYVVELLHPIRTRKSLEVVGVCDIYKDFRHDLVPIYLKIMSSQASPFIQSQTVQFKLTIFRK